MGVEKVRKDDTARTFEFLFRFNKGVDKWQVIIITVRLKLFHGTVLGR